jgi:hypothetical protein
MVKRKKKLSPEQMLELIRSIQAKFKQKPGEKSVVQELLEERRAERDRENHWELKSKSTG